jgi:hypothetical protein
MRGHFVHLHFETFPMKPRTPQGKVFWALLSSSEHSRVPKDSNSRLFQVLGFTPTLGQSRGATNRSSLNLHPKHSGTPLGVGTSHGHFGPQDTSRPGLGGSHHLPPYSILCSSRRKLHPNGTNSRDSQVGVPKLSRNCPGWSPGTLGAHNS